MSELASIQRAMARMVRGAGEADPEDARAAEAMAAGSERLSPSAQVAIYREQFALRHLDVLYDDFRAVAHVLGAEGFEALARGYLEAYPPRSFSLRDLGGELATFVAQAAPWSSDALLLDLVRTEWAFVEAFDAPDAPPLDHASVAALSEDAWPAVRIVLQPALQRLALAHPAHDLRLAVRAAAEDPVQLAAIERRPPPSPAHVVVFRGRERLQCLDVEPRAFALLDELARGTPLGEACERVAASSYATEDELGEAVGAWFQQWTALGWISRVDHG